MLLVWLRGRWHMADDEYECDCGAAFGTEKELKEHAREKHDADV